MPRDTEEGKKQDMSFRTNGFNAAVSDALALNRSVKDIRHRQCREKTYLTELPTVSVILPFYNEHWTTLLRSAKRWNITLWYTMCVDACCAHKRIKKQLVCSFILYTPSVSNVSVFRKNCERCSVTHESWSKVICKLIFLTIYWKYFAVFLHWVIFSDPSIR